MSDLGMDLTVGLQRFRDLAARYRPSMIVEADSLIDRIASPEFGAGRAVQDDGLDVERLALWIHYTRHGNRDPDFIMDEARSRAARIIEGLRAASPLNASGDER